MLKTVNLKKPSGFPKWVNKQKLFARMNCPKFFKQLNFRHHFNVMFESNTENDKVKNIIYRFIYNHFTNQPKWVSNSINFESVYNSCGPTEQMKEHNIDITKFTTIANNLYYEYFYEYEKFYIKISSMFESGSNIQELKSKIENLETENYELKLSIQEFSSLVYDTSEKQITNLEVNINDKISNLRLSISSLVEESYLKSQSFNEELKSKIENLSTENKYLEERLNKTIVMKLASMYSKQINDLKSEIGEFNSSVEDLNMENEELQSNVKELSTENQELKMLVYDILDEIKHLKEHNNCLSERILFLENKPPLIHY